MQIQQRETDYDFAASCVPRYWLWSDYIPDGQARKASDELNIARLQEIDINEVQHREKPVTKSIRAAETSGLQTR